MGLTYITVSILLQNLPVGKGGIAAAIRDTRMMGLKEPLLMCCGQCYWTPTPFIISWQGVYPNIVNDGKDHHVMAAKRYQAHLDIVHGIGAAQLQERHLPVVKLYMDWAGKFIPLLARA